MGKKLLVWYRCVIVTNKLVSNNSYDLKVYNTDDTDYSKEELTKFKKYLQYQLQQYAVGKVELVYSYGIYLKLNKKTRNISTQTDVSLDVNKNIMGLKSCDILLFYYFYYLYIFTDL